MKKAVTIAVCACAIAASAFGDTDENGKTPLYWYTFDGEVVSKGSSGLEGMTTSNFGVGRGGGMAMVGTGSPGAYGSKFNSGDGSATYVFDARVGAVSNGVFFTRGASSSSSGSFGLVTDSTLNKIKLVNWSSASADPFAVLVEAVVDGIAFRFATYAVVYDSSAGTIALYVDGVFKGSAAFGGFSDAKWQFYGINGGTTHGLKSSKAHISEFRFYQEALSAAELAQIAAAKPLGSLVDANGLRPACDIAFDSSGLLMLGAESGWLPDKADRYYGPEASGTPEPVRGNSHAATNFNSNAKYGSGFDFGGGSFTLFASARIGRSTSGAVLSFGKASSTSGNLALASRGNDHVAVCTWNGSTVTEILSADSTRCSDCYHAYAIVYDSSRSLMTFYVDGEERGSVSHGGMGAGYDGSWCIGGVYNTHSKLTTPSGLSLERATLYRQALTAEQVATLCADFPAWRDGARTDAAGFTPVYWYRFANETATSSGTADLITGSSSSDNSVELYPSSWPVGRKGRTDAGYFIYPEAQHYPWGMRFAPGTDNFTIFFCGRIGKKASSMIFTIGKKDDAPGGISFTCNGQDEVAVSTWAGEAAHTDLLSASAAGLSDTVHAYAVTWDGAALKLYVDGSLEDSTDEYAGLSGVTRAWQFGGINGGISSQTGLSSSTTYTVEDFRFYSRALTAAQVAAISADFPAWPNGLVWGASAPGSWSDSSWLAWNMTSWGWAETAFVPGTNVVIDVDASIAVPAGMVAGRVEIGAAVSLTGSPLECSSLVVAEGSSLVPGVVSAAVSPPACLAVIGAGGVEGLDFTVKDAYGNSYFVNPRLNRLYFGKPIKGFFIGIR